MNGDATRRLKIRPRRCARGEAFILPVANAVVSLFNDSRAAELLVLLDIRVVGDAASSACDFGVNNGALGNFSRSGDPVITGDAQKPGALYTLDTATPPPTNWSFGGSLGAQGLPMWPHDFPFCILEPGWCAFVSDEDTAENLDVSFFWMVIRPEELDPLFD